MSEINYNDPALKDAAFKLAEETPRHLDQPTTPPIHWRLEGDILRVLLADGRTVRAPLADYQKKKPVAPQLMGLPTRRDPIVPPANLTCASTTGAGKPDGKKKPPARPK